MDLYSILIFVHVLGAVALFASLAVEVVAVRRLRTAGTVEQARTWMGVLGDADRVGHPGMLAILVAGVWMMAIRWGPEPWIVTALVGVVIMAALGAGPSRRATAGLHAALAGAQEPLAPDLHALARGPLTVSLRMRLAIAVGILGLMTMKPGVLGSLVILGAALGAGAAATMHPKRQGAPAIQRSGAS